MAIPDFQTIMLPLLDLAGDGETRQIRKPVDILAQHFALTDDETRELVPSGRQPRFHNRVSWARTYLAKAGLLESPKRGYFSITDRGRDVLTGKPSEINIKFLEQFEEFKSFRQLRRALAPPVDATELGEGISADTPEETLQAAYLELRKNLADDLLEEVKKSPPGFFERLVVDLLVRMGYGGSRQEAGERPSAAPEMRVSTGLLKRTAWAWTSSMSRPSDGRASSADPRCRSSPAPCRGSERARESLSQRPRSLARRRSTQRKSRPRSY